VQLKSVFKNHGFKSQKVKYHFRKCFSKLDMVTGYIHKMLRNLFIVVNRVLCCLTSESNSSTVNQHTIHSCRRLNVFELQDFDFCPNLIKFYPICPNLTQIYPNLPKNICQGTASPASPAPTPLKPYTFNSSFHMSATKESFISSIFNLSKHNQLANRLQKH